MEKTCIYPKMPPKRNVYICMLKPSRAMSTVARYNNPEIETTQVSINRRRETYHRTYHTMEHVQL